ncbi:hypothetical protein GCM10011391_11740 [Pullulanibacillus camelliae]|uniref:Uncharacterized protein n=1 Tax=Pullulanibacillus camelliae TaxID=1707096 RepID=A0A8J2VPG9_9BACL|nr:DUF6241 domain-containing protein [Pullulanibacillus camelliae]GGE34767.1 hypothetical protein GCM10011391_11740 [Pullulanibacillus camelliae]
MTQERVDRLFKGLDENTLTHGDFYRSILTRWSKGDFSHVAQDHNAI